ncbi:MAG TPA: GTP 3',8-cyclase MoaA [Myxococcales bacterium]|nr:GTP 3',8-cyclase MoaA [Myxococcales bacterium]
MPDPRPSQDPRELLRELRDAQGRRISYLRLSVTDRCNYRCVYCSPAEGARADLTRGQLRRLLGAFAGLGVRRVRLTGGEPLWRKDIVALAADAASTPGIDEVCLSTNGTNLVALARSLREAGVCKINVSLDSLDPGRFASITRGGRVDEVTDGIEAALEAGFAEVAINAVILRGVNEADAAPLVRWCWERGLTPRFIELMPFASGAPVPTDELVARLARDGLSLGPELPRPEGRGPASYRRGSGGEVGFIGALTHNFCASCNRLRVSTRGELQACLGGAERVPLAPLLEEGVPPPLLEGAIRAALSRKEEGHRFLEPRVGGRLLSMMGIGG